MRMSCIPDDLCTSNENNNKPWSDKTYAVSWDFKKTCCFVEY